MTSDELIKTLNAIVRPGDVVGAAEECVSYSNVAGDVNFYLNESGEFANLIQINFNTSAPGNYEGG